jgi:hypothetical protein
LSFERFASGSLFRELNAHFDNHERSPRSPAAAVPTIETKQPPGKQFVLWQRGKQKKKTTCGSTTDTTMRVSRTMTFLQPRGAHDGVLQDAIRRADPIRAIEDTIYHLLDAIRRQDIGGFLPLHVAVLHSAGDRDPR